MRIRYAYKLEDAEGNVSYTVQNWILSEEEVLAKFAEKGIVKATFHVRVRTGYRLNENGELVETGLTKPQTKDAPATAPASSKEPKTKKTSKKAKAK